MICPNCGKAIEHMSEFCKYCGKPTNAAERYNYRPSAAPIRGAGTEPGGSRDNTDTRTRDALESLAAYVQKLPTQKQMKAVFFRYSLILALFTLLCTAICAIGIAKNRAAIAELKEQSSLMAAQVLKSDVPEDTATPEITPEPTPTVTPVQVTIRFDLNLPNGADLAKFPQLPENIATTQGEEVTLPTLPDTDTYRFIGWNTRESGNGKRYSADTSLDFVIKDDLVLYAQWELIDKN